MASNKSSQGGTHCDANPGLGTARTRQQQHTWSQHPAAPVIALVDCKTTLVCAGFSFLAAALEKSLAICWKFQIAVSFGGLHPRTGVARQVTSRSWAFPDKNCWNSLPFEYSPSICNFIWKQFLQGLLDFHQNCFQKYRGSKGWLFPRHSLSLWPLRYPQSEQAQRIHHEKQSQKHTWASLACQGEHIALSIFDSICWKSATLKLKMLIFEVSGIRKFVARADPGMVSCKGLRAGWKGLNTAQAIGGRCK